MTNTSRLSQLQSMLADDPNDPFLRYALAMELESASDTDGAIVALQTLLQAHPEYVPGFLQAGQLLIKAGRVEEAKSMLTLGMQTAFKQADHHAYEEMEGILAGISAP